MKITHIIESTRPIKSAIRNAYIDFSKMTALGAAMRKLAHLCFGVIRTQSAYDPNYKAMAA